MSPEPIMPIALIMLVLNVVLIVHAAKTGRFQPWGYIILFLPGVGGLAYIVAELVPEWFGSPQGQQTRSRVVNRLNPERRYRALVDHLAIADTIANREALADECLELGKYAEAEEHYKQILARPLGDEPPYMLGRARAEFGLGRDADTITTLDELRERWPNFPSAEGHLLYARALERAGRLQEAIEEYKALADYYPGAESRARYGLLLRKMGRDAEAVKVLTDLLAQMRLAPRYVRKVQAQWIAMAEKALRG
jgi:hypothetical protein